MPEADPPDRTPPKPTPALSPPPAASAPASAQTPAHASAQSPSPAPSDSAAPSDVAGKKRTPPRRHKWRRRILIGLVVFLLLLVVSVQLIFWSNIPRNLILPLIQNQTGLRIEADTLSTGWFGDTTLTDVTVSLPLSADDAFFKAPELHINHSSIFGIILGRFEIESITLDHPTLVLRQDAQGQWNVQEAIALAGRSGGSEAAARQGAASPANRPAALALPHVQIIDATLALYARDGKQMMLNHVEFEGKPDGPLVYDLKLSVDRYLNVAGRAAPGQGFRHELRFALKDGAAMLSPIVGDGVEALELAGNWTGQLGGQLGGPAGFSGRLTLDDASRINAARIYGSLSVDSPSGAIAIHPESLTVAASGREGTLVGGQIVIAGGELSLNALTARVMGGTARLNGSASLASQTADVSGDWIGIAAPRGTTMGGSVHATIDRPWPDRRRLHVDLQTHGKTGAANWTSAIQLDGTGGVARAPSPPSSTPSASSAASASSVASPPAAPPGDGDGQSGSDIGSDNSSAPAMAIASPDNWDWSLRIPSITCETGGKVRRLDGLYADVSQTGPALKLTHLGLAQSGLAQPGHLSGDGEYHLDTGDWHSAITLRDLSLPRAANPAVIELAAGGDHHRATLDHLTLNVAALSATLKGEYVYHRPEPVAATLSFTRKAQPSAAGEPGLGGDLTGELTLGGTTDPLKLGFTGKINGQDVHFGRRVLRELGVGLSGVANDTGLFFNTDHFSAFDGEWDFAGSYLLDTQMASLAIDIKSLSLAALDDLVAPPPDVAGLLDAHIQIAMPDADASKLAATGHYSVAKLATTRNAGTLTELPIEVESITGRLEYADDLLHLFNIRATQPPPTPPAAGPADAGAARTGATDTGATGTRASRAGDASRPAGGAVASADITLSTRAPRELTLAFQPNGWLLHLPRAGVDASLTGSGRLQIDPAAGTITGPLDLQVPIRLRDEPVATLALKADFTGRGVNAKSISATALGGTLDGTARVSFDDPTLDRVNLAWKEMDLSRLPLIPDRFGGLAGTLAGSFEVAPDPDPRAIEPLRLKLHLDPEDAHWRDVSIGPAYFSAYASGGRAVLDESHIVIDGGFVQVWARYTNPIGEPFVHATVRLNNLQIEPVMHAFDENAHPANGRLSGEITAFGPPSEKPRWLGQGHLAVADSNLLNSDILSFLYNAMSLNRNNGSTGRGSVDFRLENQTLSILGARYFHEGVEVRASGDIGDAFDPAQSPVNIEAVGSASPLGGISLPLLADADKILGAIQGNVTTVEVTGELKKPKIRIVPFSEVSSGLRRLLVGDVSKETAGGASE